MGIIFPIKSSAINITKSRVVIKLLSLRFKLIVANASVRIYYTGKVFPASTSGFEFC